MTRSAQVQYATRQQTRIMLRCYGFMLCEKDVKDT
jgi:hypothetical protein